MNTVFQKLTIAAVILFILMSVTGCESDAGASYEQNYYELIDRSSSLNEEQIADNICYEIYEYHWENGKMYMRGTICNYNKNYDVLGFEETKFIVSDANGLPLFEAAMNTDYQEKIRLKPQSKAPYNFTSKALLYDESEYVSLTSGLQVTMEGGFEYSECDGAGCTRCHNVGLALNSNPFIENISVDPEPDTKNCFFCDFSGKCSSCDGDGKMELLEGSIWGTGCRTCDGDGICTACNGDGIMG